MAGIPHDHYEPKTSGERWLHKRLPIVGLLYDTIMIPTPKNLNYWWTFGAILAVCLVIQIITGLLLIASVVAGAVLAWGSRMWRLASGSRRPPTRTAGKSPATNSEEAPNTVAPTGSSNRNGESA